MRRLGWSSLLIVFQIPRRPPIREFGIDGVQAEMAGRFRVVAFVQQRIIIRVLVADVGDQCQPGTDCCRITAQMARGGLGLDGFRVQIGNTRRP